jgi:hypothetical protein
VFPGTVGPISGKPEAKVLLIAVAKTAVYRRSLGSEGFTEGVGSVWYATTWGFEKHKMF